MSERRDANGKRPSGHDDGRGVAPAEPAGNDPKKPKWQPTPSRYPRVFEDERKWELLPAVVYELLTLIKKSEIPNPDGCRRQKAIEKNEVLPNSNDQNAIFNVEIKNNYLKECHGIVKMPNEKPNKKLLNTEESKKLFTYKSFIGDSVQNFEDLNFLANKTEKVNEQIGTTLTTETTDVNIENILKEEKKKNETNEKKGITKTFSPTEKFFNNNVGNNISEAENLITLSKKEQLFNILNDRCLNGISKIPTSKPYPCTCKYCLYVSNLPKDQLAVNSLYTSLNDSNIRNFNQNYKPNDFCVMEMQIYNCSVCAKNDCCC